MEQFWLVILAVSTPIAGVVGFAVQLRTVRKVRLENQKLALEIQRLNAELENSARLVVPATDREIQRYGGVDFSLGGFKGPCPGDESAVTRKTTFKEAVIMSAVLAAAALFVAYLLFDLYRAAMWLRSVVSG